MQWIASVLLVFSMVGVALAQQPSGPPADTKARVDKLFAKWDKPDSPGCALAVFQGDRIVYERGYGMADLDHDIPIVPSTVFHVASMSKQFTAASILLLAQEGKLALDDEVRKYFPEMPDFGVPIAIRHLIHHTSGLRDQWDLLNLAGWRESLDLITDEDVLAVLARQKDLNFPPGEKHVYCNTGYTLLGQVVKRASGQSLREFTRARIFEPLGMKNTHFRDDHAEIVKNMAYGYEPAKGGTFRLSVTNFDTVGATSLLTTVEDLALWDENFYNPRVGGPELVKRMLERGRLNSGKQLDYAFGLVIGKYRGLPTVDHGGSDAGYRSDMVRFAEQHLTVACLCNAAESNPSELTRNVADIYLAGELKPLGPAESDEKPIQLSEAQLKSKVGIYWKADEDRTAKIIFKDGKLYLVDGDDTLELKPLDENRFRLLIERVEFAFKSNPTGGPVKLSIAAIEDEPEVFEAITPYVPTAAQLGEYAGAYRSEEIEPLYRIQVEDGKLVLRRLKFKPSTLEPALRDLYLGLWGNLRFTRDSQGRLLGFIFNDDRIRNFRFVKQQP